MIKAPVAQLDRASDFGSEGWGFESLQAREKEEERDELESFSCHIYNHISR